MSKPTMKHIQFARDDIQALAKRLNLLTARVTLLEKNQDPDTSASKSTKK
jgi:hypothetical protein